MILFEDMDEDGFKAACLASGYEPHWLDLLFFRYRRLFIEKVTFGDHKSKWNPVDMYVASNILGWDVYVDVKSWRLGGRQPTVENENLSAWTASVTAEYTSRGLYPEFKCEAHSDLIAMIGGYYGSGDGIPRRELADMSCTLKNQCKPGDSDSIEKFFATIEKKLKDVSNTLVGVKFCMVAEAAL